MTPSRTGGHRDAGLPSAPSEPAESRGGRRELEGLGAPRVVAIGGGHGLAGTLRALRRLPVWPVAVVSVADDGGSTGRLRSDAQRVAPGDIRKCLGALAGRCDPLTAVMEHRFTSGELKGHAFGNLLLAAFEESEGSLLGALAVVSELLEVEGTVLPATSTVVDLVGETIDGSAVEGQVVVSATPGVEKVWLRPDPLSPPEALDAISDAAAIVLGPGSLYTSVLAAAVVPGIAEAVAGSDAPVVYICNLHPQVPETDGYGVAQHVEALVRHGLVPDVVLYDPDHIGGADEVSGATPARLAQRGGLAHDPELVATVLGDILGVGP